MSYPCLTVDIFLSGHAKLVRVYQPVVYRTFVLNFPLVPWRYRRRLYKHMEDDTKIDLHELACMHYGEDVYTVKTLD